MTAGTLDTVIRMNVDSAQGVASTNKLNTAMTSLKSRGVTSLGSGFGSLATQAIAASGASQALGVQGTFLSGTLSMAAQSVGMINPLLLAMTIAGTAAVTMFLNKRKATDDLRESLEKYSSTLEKVAAGDSAYIGIATRLLDIRRQLAEQELLQLQTKIALAEAGLREATMMDRLIAYLASGAGTYGVLAAQMALVNIEADEQDKLLGKLLEQWQKLSDSIGSGARGAESDILSLRSRVLELQQALAKASGGASPAQAQALYQAEAQLIEDRYAQQIAAAEGNNAAIALLEEAKFLTLQQLQLEYTNNYPLILEGIVVAHEDAANKIRLTEEKYRDLNAKGAKKSADDVKKIQLTTAQVQLRSMAATAAQMLIIQKASLGETIEAIIAEQQARLASIAIVAAVEAVFYAFTNPAKAAAAATAAVMAGSGAVALGAIRGMISGPGGGGEEQAADEQGALAGTDGRSGVTGRTLVQQGPLTLNYRATMIVNGHVFSVQDIFEMWLDFNANQLRAAGVQSDELRR